MDSELNNKLVVKNAIMLTFRMIIATIVGLYTSRIVLEALGVEDYGLYGLVGGMVGMVTFLNGAMGGATSRFITYEIGCGNKGNLKRVFSTSFIIHFFIAIIGIIIVEIVGLWMINNKLEIPQSSMFAAHVVFQLSIASIAVSFTQVPYSSIILAYEKMSIYAYFEILNVTLKLLVAYLLLVVPSQRLILYATCNFIISVSFALMYRWYCVRHFSEAKVQLKLDKSYAKRMLSYSGYNLYGNFSIMIYLQGLPILLNMFFGLLANAASSIGTTVTGVIKGLTWSISNAFGPQVTKQYAAGNIQKMESVMCRSIQFTVLPFTMVAIPFLIETERILYLWLGQIPTYSVVFLRYIVLVSIIDYLTMSNNRAIQATGKIKYVSLISGTFYLITPFISFVILKFHGPVYTPYLINAIMLCIVTLIGVKIIKYQIPSFDVPKYIITIFKTYGVSGCSVVIVYAITRTYDEPFTINSVNLVNTLLLVASTTAIGFIIVGLSSYYIALNTADRVYIKQKVSFILKNFHKWLKTIS